MAVFRVIKNENYTTVCNEHLQDKMLSLKAKGLLTMMLSLSDSWNYSVSGLVAICKEGRTAVESALKELKDRGYLVVEKLAPEKGERNQFEYVYNIYESPSRGLSQGSGNLPLENIEQLNTNNKGGVDDLMCTQPESDCKLGSIAQSTESKGRFAPPTRDDVLKYAREKGYADITPTEAARFMAYYESNGWMVGRNKMRSWRAAVTNWHLRNNIGSKPQRKEPEYTPPAGYLERLREFESKHFGGAS